MVGSVGTRPWSVLFSGGAPSERQAAPWHFLYFWPDPQGQGSLRPTLSSLRTVPADWAAAEAASLAEPGAVEVVVPPTE